MLISSSANRATNPSKSEQAARATKEVCFVADKKINEDLVGTPTTFLNSPEKQKMHDIQLEFLQ